MEFDEWTIVGIAVCPYCGNDRVMLTKGTETAYQCSGCGAGTEWFRGDDDDQDESSTDSKEQRPVMRIRDGTPRGTSLTSGSREHRRRNASGTPCSPTERDPSLSTAER